MRNGLSLSLRYQDKTSLLNAIRSLPYPGGETATAEGLRAMRTQVFGRQGDRPFVNNTAIIVTDGLPTRPNDVPAEISQVFAKGITTYAVGVTNRIDKETLKSLSSYPQKVQYSITFYLLRYQSIQALL